MTKTTNQLYVKTKYLKISPFLGGNTTLMVSLERLWACARWYQPVIPGQWWTNGVVCLKGRWKLSHPSRFAVTSTQIWRIRTRTMQGLELLCLSLIAHYIKSVHSRMNKKLQNSANFIARFLVELKSSQLLFDCWKFLAVFVLYHLWSTRGMHAIIKEHWSDQG